jgi:hypothetical protein
VYKLPLDPARIVRATATAFANQTRRDQRRAVAADCDGSGMPMRLGCTDRAGRVFCPICRRRVNADVAGPKLVHLARHCATDPLSAEATQ